jgi:hypothetical protein
MNISGPRSVSAVNAPQQELDLRPFQRVTAQVVTVTGTTALLIIDGYPVVAQLTSGDQASTLLSQPMAQFIVTQRTNRTVTLKIAENDEPSTNVAGPISRGPELAVRVLEQHNIPITANHLIIARAMLRKHLPMIPALLNEIEQTLSSYGSWGRKEAELAAALKAARLPLTAQSLALASHQAARIGDSFARLIARLTDMSGQVLPQDVLQQLHRQLEDLLNTTPSMDSEPSQMAGRLKATVEMLGRSLESVLLEQSQNTEEFGPIGRGLIPLAQLQRRLEQAGKNELADTISEFLKDLRWSQFLNARLDTGPPQSEWAEIGFAVKSPQQSMEHRFSSGRLRIAYESTGGSRKINSACTRLILQVDLAPGQTVEVDLAVVDKHIKTSVTAPDAVWCGHAQEEVPALERALRALGYTLKAVQIDLAQPQLFERLKVAETQSLMTVDIEV